MFIFLRGDVDIIVPIILHCRIEIIFVVLYGIILGRGYDYNCNCSCTLCIMINCVGDDFVLRRRLRGEDHGLGVVVTKERTASFLLV